MSSFWWGYLVGLAVMWGWIEWGRVPWSIIVATILWIVIGHILKLKEVNDEWVNRSR